MAIHHSHRLMERLQVLLWLLVSSCGCEEAVLWIADLGEFDNDLVWNFHNKAMIPFSGLAVAGIDGLLVHEHVEIMPSSR